MELDLDVFSPPLQGPPGAPVVDEPAPEPTAEAVAEASEPLEGPEDLSPLRAEPHPEQPEVETAAADRDAGDDLPPPEIPAAPEGAPPADTASSEVAKPAQETRSLAKKPRAKAEGRTKRAAQGKPVGRRQAQTQKPNPKKRAELARADATQPAPVGQGGGAGAAGDAPTEAQMGTTRQTAPSRSAGAAEAAYLAELQRAIARHQRFPDDARRRQRTGVATLSFVVLGDGRIRQVRVLSSSGDASLDEAAVEAMQRLNRFKPIPAVIGRQEWAMRVPIRFDLR
jgi:protein TonB